MGKPKKEILASVGKSFSTAANQIASAAGSAVDGVTTVANKAKENAFHAMDVNGDGVLDIEDLIVGALQLPGVCVNRADFLRVEFKKRYPETVIDDSIAHNPAHAKIPREDIDRIADEVIRYERNCVSGISAVLGMPGGVAMVATIPADIIQYYGYMLRTAQKLMYLYGFPEINAREGCREFDAETLNLLVICLGVMYGVAGASNAIKAMARALANGVERKIVHSALTKGTIYPVVKNVAGWFGKKMTKEVFAGFFKKAIPVVGGVLGGSITFASFKPCCDKLKASLRETLLAGAQEDGGLIVVELKDEM